VKLGELLRGAEVTEVTADLDTDILGVYNDSRKVKPGGIFAAVPGFAEDGANYIPAAIEAGARVILAEKPCKDIPCVVVKDARKALSRVAANFYERPSERMKVIGITGTNGKTTTTYLIKHIIDRYFGVSAGLIGTNEIIIGDRRTEAARTTPESADLQKILREMADAGTGYAVMEVSSHALKLNRVDDILFEVGIFSNLTQDHLDFHRSMEDYLEAKSKLFTMCKKGVINIDDSASEKILETAACEVTTYSVRRQDADLIAKNVRLSPAKVEFEALGRGEISRVELGIPGEFSVYNALAAVGACMQLGIPLRSIAEAMKDCEGVKGRAEVVRTDTPYTVLIDYAHTPDALENILVTLKGFVKGRLICVFGCGGDRDASKRPVMGQTAERYSDVCIVTSDNPRTEVPERIIGDIVSGMKKAKKKEIICDRTEAIHYALDMARENDCILLAGKGHETYQEVNGVKRHMDEREIVRDYLRGKKG
jgi:UDP-N-acetylmuramoyl-L-alanyl-D-glutamate--2,6-diaminopimelate ligase